MSVKSFRELFAWQKAMDLVVSVYEQSRGFPREEIFGLTSQLRRAAVSVPSNIAEGQGRATTREFLHFLSIANGSLCEAQTQILIGARLEYLDAPRCDTLIEATAEVGRLLNGLTKSLQQKLS